MQGGRVHELLDRGRAFRSQTTAKLIAVARGPEAALDEHAPAPALSSRPASRRVSPVGSQRRVQVGAVARRSDSVPIIPTAQHVGQPRHAATATGRSTNETGPSTPSRRIAPSTASNPTAPRSKWRWTEEDASGEREDGFVISW
jgi:hypothetical protein